MNSYSIIGGNKRYLENNFNFLLKILTKCGMIHNMLKMQELQNRLKSSVQLEIAVLVIVFWAMENAKILLRFYARCNFGVLLFLIVFYFCIYYFVHQQMWIKNFKQTNYIHSQPQKRPNYVTGWRSMPYCHLYINVLHGKEEQGAPGCIHQ